MSIYDRRNRQELDVLVEEYTTKHTVSRRQFLRRATATGLSLSAATALLVACGGAPAGPATSNNKVTQLDVVTQWGNEELASYQAINAAFTQKTGIKINVESTRDLNTVLGTRLKGNNPPDISGMPGLDFMHQQADAGKLVPLDKFMDMNQIKQNYADGWIKQASWKGHLYAVLPKANGKATVWYSPKEFQANGWKVPATWDDMIALSDKIAAAGKYPWSLGVESAASSGWPAVDWVSEIYINKYGDDMYQQWYQHKIPWTHASIKDSIQMFGKIAQGNHYVNGGSKAILSTNFQDATYSPFSSPPKAYMNYLGDFAIGFITTQFKGIKAGTDYGFFPFPTINTQYKGAIVGGSDTLAALKDNDAVREYMKYLATADAQAIWVKRGGSTSVNKGVSLSDYPDDVARESAQILTNATAVELSIGDLLPGSLQTAYWKGMVSYIGDPTKLDSILAGLESTAQSAYQS